eukprot:g3902.t1
MGNEFTRSMHEYELAERVRIFAEENEKKKANENDQSHSSNGDGDSMTSSKALSTAA